MANIQDQISAARKAGYSDQEIQQYLQNSPEVQQALKQGYSAQDVWGHLGLAPQAPQASAPPSGTAPSGPKAGPEWLRVPEILGSGLVTGVANTLGLPGTLTELANRSLPNAITRPIGSAPGTPPDRLLPTGPEIMDFLHSVGLPQAPAALGPLERYASAGAMGLGSALPLVAGGPIALAGELGAGVAGGLGAEAGSEVSGGNPLVTLAGGLLGGYGAGKLAQGVEGLVARQGAKSAAAAAAEAKATAEAAKQQHTELKNQQEDLNISHKEANIAGAQRYADAVTQAKEQASSNISAATAPAEALTESVAKGLGSATTLQQAGTALQASARNWLANKMPKALDEIWKPLDSGLSGEEGDISNFERALEEINSSSGALEPLAKVLKPSAPARLADALKAVTAGQVEGTAPAISWTDMRKLRSTIGNAMSNPATIRDVGQQNLAALYGAITADMRGVAAQAGPDTAKAFDAANAQSTKLYDFAQGPLAKVIGGKAPSADDPLPEDAARKLLAGGKAGGTDLAALSAAMPDATKQLAAAGLRLGHWQGLSPEAQAALLPDASARSALATTYASRDAGIAAAREAQGQAIAGAQASAKALRAQQQAEKIALARQVQGAKLAHQNALEELRLRAAAQDTAEQAVGKQDLRLHVYHLGQAFGGGAGGYLLANELTHQLGITPGWESAAGLAMGMAPYAFRKVGDVARNPNLLAPPGIGAAAAIPHIVIGGAPGQLPKE